jgi:hypothetical protein
MRDAASLQIMSKQGKSDLEPFNFMVILFDVNRTGQEDGGVGFFLF